MQSEHSAREMTGTDALSEEFCRAAARAYTRPYLVSNQALSKINQHSLFFKYSQGEAAQFASSFSVALNVLLFYAKSLIEMLLLAGALFLQKISPYQVFSKGQQKLFIDAYVVVDSKTKAGLENYFPLLRQLHASTIGSLLFCRDSMAVGISSCVKSRLPSCVWPDLMC